jgi:hypothetical protein
MVVAIIGVLAMISLSATDVQLDVEPLDEPPSGAGEPAFSPNKPGAEARWATCEANYRSVEAASATMQAATGRLALTVEELVQGGWLSSAPTPAADFVTLEVVEGTATGRILVNGQPGPGACAS